MALLDLATGSLLADVVEVATLLEPNADSGALAAAASGNAGPIAIRFPVVGDGRGIILARAVARAARLHRRDQGGRPSDPRPCASSCCARASTPPRSPIPSRPRPGRRRSRASSTIISRAFATFCRCAATPRARRRGSSTSGSPASRASPTASGRCGGGSKAASSSPPAFGSRIRRSCMPSPNPAPTSTSSPSIPAGCFRRCWRPSSCRSCATACASAWSRPMPARSSSWSPATACSASATRSRTARPAARSAKCARSIAS